MWAAVMCMRFASQGHMDHCTQCVWQAHSDSPAQCPESCIGNLESVGRVPGEQLLQVDLEQLEEGLAAVVACTRQAGALCKLSADKAQDRGLQGCDDCLNRHTSSDRTRCHLINEHCCLLAKQTNLFRRGLLRSGVCAMQLRGIARADCQPNHTCSNSMA